MLASCTLTVAGQRVTALDSLTVTWGRDNATTQPPAATCTASLFVDDAATALQMYTIGRKVTVSSDIATYTTGTAVPYPAASATAIYGTVDAAGRIRSDADGDDLAILTIPPARPSDDPAAWDSIPVAESGTTWTIEAALDLPAGASVSIRPCYYASPSGAPSFGEEIASIRQTGTVRATWTIPPAARRKWVGVVLVAGPTGLTWNTSPVPWKPGPRAWTGLNTITLRSVMVTRPKEATTIQAEVFAGSITDVSLEYNEAAKRPVLQVTAADMLAELEHVRVSSEPWATQPLSDRLNNIVRALPKSVTPTITVDPVPASRSLIWQDADSQSAAALFKDAATSAGAVLWSATHRLTGPYLKFEDPSTRGALGKLTFAGNQLHVSAQKAAHTLSASQLLREGNLTQSNGDAASVVRLTWKEPGVDPDGKRTATDRTITIEDKDLISRIGYREISLSTSLAIQAEAEAAAARLFRTYLPGGFNIPHLTLDTRVHPERLNPDTLATLLDATRRLGLILSITDLPAWYPARTMTTYIDGGRYTYENQRWKLELNASTTAATGRGLTWNQLPPATWKTSRPLTWALAARLTY